MTALWWWLGVGIVVIALVGFYLSMTAGRLDRLHQRIDTSALTLDGHLLRRSATCLELAASGLLDPATSLVIVEAAHESRRASDRDDAERALVESNLTAALGAALDVDEVAEVDIDPDGRALLDDLAASCRRVELSRRFHNDAVRACRQVRRQRLVRLFRLAGHTPWPETWEMDDAMPEGLRSR
jgi:hypothetical protein